LLSPTLKLQRYFDVPEIVAPPQKNEWMKNKIRNKKSLKLSQLQLAVRKEVNIMAPKPPVPFKKVVEAKQRTEPKV